MSLTEQLKRDYTAPAYAEPLKQFKRGIIAERVGVSTGYICNILTGSKYPGLRLEQRLIRLAAQVEYEQGLKEQGLKV